MTGWCEIVRVIFQRIKIMIDINQIINLVIQLKEKIPARRAFYKVERNSLRNVSINITITFTR